MKAISLWQPWASAIFGPKRYETRGWQTPYRGPLLIHAAKTWNAELKLILYEFQDDGILPRGEYPKGALLGIVDLVAIERTDDVRAGRGKYPLGEHELKLGNFSDGRFAWRLENPRRFEEPILFAGKQGIFDVSHPLILALVNSMAVA